MRALAPADALVYLEANDLGSALQPIIDSRAFNEASMSKPDLAVLKGVQLAVAVTGFESREERLTDQDSIGRVQPRFVAIADTHAWNYQAVAFAEQHLGGFIADLYNSEPKMEKADKHGGKYFTWTAGDGRTAFALVIDSIIYFANDESAIEKAIAVTRGETDSIAKTGKMPPRAEGSLAAGYVSTDGVAQIAGLAGMGFASQASDDEDVQSTVAGILPQIIRGTVSDISWTTNWGKPGYEDKFVFGGTPESAPALAETMAPTPRTDPRLFDLVWAKAPSITQYNFDRPNIAWRGLLLTTRSKLDAFGSKVVGEFSGAFAEPYGVKDPETFLSGVGSNIVTLRTDAEGEKPALIVSVTNAEAVRRSLLPDLKPDKAASDASGFEVLKDEDTTAVFAGDVLLIGDSEAVETCLQAHRGGTNLSTSPGLLEFFRPNISSVTLSVEEGQAAALAALLSRREPRSTAPTTVSVTETRFTRGGIERRTVSEFGFIGWLAAQLNDN